jgi:Ca2+-binding EF-hand superfamily protein
MKTIPLSLIVAGMLAPLGALAQSPPAPPAPDAENTKRATSRRFLEAWLAADKNGDGFLSKEEFAMMPRIQRLAEEKRQHVFERLDKNGDGQLSRAELVCLGPRRDDPRPPRQRLWELDTDQNGSITFEEFAVGEFFKKLPPARQEAVFRRLDADGDGLITHQDKPK